jgi:hypothetical protein
MTRHFKCGNELRRFIKIRGNYRVAEAAQEELRSVELVSYSRLFIQGGSNMTGTICV